MSSALNLWRSDISIIIVIIIVFPIPVITPIIIPIIVVPPSGISVVISPIMAVISVMAIREIIPFGMAIGAASVAIRTVIIVAIFIILGQFDLRVRELRVTIDDNYTGCNQAHKD
jgi:hypothetical protein